LINWPALRLAVTQGWGTEAARDALVTEVADLIEDREVEPEFVAEVLEEALAERFSVVLDDNSSIEIARILLRAFEESLNDDSATLEELRRINPTLEFSKGARPADIEITPSLEALDMEGEDEDGFTIVKGGHKSRR
jgi:hypothetical protein